MRGETRTGEQLRCSTSAEEASELDGYMQREGQATAGTMS